MVTEPELDEPGPRIVYVNPAFTRMTGYTADEALGRNPRFLQGPGTDPEVAAAIGRDLRAHKTVRIEMVNHRKDGTAFWVEHTIRPVYDEAGHLTHFVAIQRETTDRHRALDALRASESRYRSLFEHSLDGILILDLEGHILDANPAITAMLAWSVDEVRGRRATEFMDGPDDERRRIVEDCHRTGHVRGEIDVVHKDGRRIRVEVASCIVTSVNARRQALFIRDVTERRAAERRLALLAAAGKELTSGFEVHTRLEALAALVVPELARCAMIAVGDGDRLERVALAHADGPEAQQRLATLTDDLEAVSRGLDLHEVLVSGTPTFIPDAGPAWAEATFPDPRLREAAERLDLSCLAAVPLCARGRTLGVLWMGRTSREPCFGHADLAHATELAARAGLAVDNARLFEAAREAARSREEVLAVVSHDLRNPVQAIRIDAQFARRRLPSQPGPRVVDEALERIERAAERADRLIRDLMDVVALEAGVFELAATDEDPLEILQGVVTMARPIAHERDLELVVWAEGSLPRVLTDRHRLQQALENLVGNAMKFTPAGGRIELGARREADALHLWVADTGPGIAARDLPRVFDRFWRAAPSRAGFGLGLAISKSLVEALGGRIDVDSHEGRGTVVHIRLPLCGPSAA